MSEKQQSIQDTFLNAARKEKVQITVYLTSGVKLQGIISGFDNFSMVLRRGPQTQLVYKHSIATIVPATPLKMYNNTDSDSATEASSSEGQPSISAEGSFQIA